ncbi:MAG TPA: phospholipase D family protein [Noviherbaspirillum sp.]|nr:phospholipase D family protein [Noviherbaspirillum sp.]
MIRRASFAVGFVFIILLAGSSAIAADLQQPLQPLRLPALGSVQAVFAPWDDIETEVIDVIGSAKKQVLVQAYLLTNKKIATTLIAAHRRGIEVNVLLDAGQVEEVDSSVVQQLAAAGLPVWLETRYQNAHNKVMVVDAGTADAAVITGSFNFTWTAQHKNAENVLIARGNPALAARYAQNWERHRQDAVPYKK